MAVPSPRRRVSVRLALVVFALLFVGLPVAYRLVDRGAPAEGAAASLFETKGKKKKKDPARKRMEAVRRMTYERNRLADPRTGRIPLDIRARELAFAARLPQAAAGKTGSGLYRQDWIARGPSNVGGRTRALAVDVRYDGATNRRILAGGVSGGVYRSDDGGQSWTLTTSLADLAAVTAIAQDPAQPDVWYYGSGEYLGSSAAGGGNYAQWGHGLFKSTDGGASWHQLASTVEDNRPTQYDSPFDVVWSLAVHPETSALYAAVAGGILVSADGGASWVWSLVDGESDTQPVMTDVAVAADGSLYAALSRNGGAHAYGVFHSTDGGVTWDDVTPPGLSEDPYRMVLGPAPSDAATLYVLAMDGEAGEASADHQLFRYDAAAGTWTDIDFAASISQVDDYIGWGTNQFQSQGGYDLVVRVKPDDPETFWIGGVNLYRTTDGGATFTLVGGINGTDYGSYPLYPNHHPDQHALAFLPNDPNTMISAHDGGLSLTTNALEPAQTWTPINDGYVTTQFYAIAIDPQPGSEFIVGGLQDNGNWGTFDRGTEWTLVPFSGDGAVAAVAPGGVPFYVSVQNGTVIRVDDLATEAARLVQPAGYDDTDFLFVTPYVLDPNDARVMYMAVSDHVARNSNLDEIPDGNSDVTDVNWTALRQSALGGGQVTALAVSTAPAGRLYFGGTDFESATVLVRVDDPAGDGPGVDVTPEGVVPGSYPSALAVNPTDADEVLAVFSNYGVPSLFHTTDGGATWTDVEGNLSGDDGPSIRWAAVAPANGGTAYFVATSTGVYATTDLAGAATVWEQQGADVIGNAVVDMLAVRPEDGYLVAGTHGRGVYSAYLSAPGGVANEPEGELPGRPRLAQNYPNPFNPTTTIRFDLPQAMRVRLDVYDLAGRRVATLAEGLRAAGAHEATWDARDAASGAYVYRLETTAPGGQRHVVTKQMTLLK